MGGHRFAENSPDHGTRYCQDTEDSVAFGFCRGVAVVGAPSVLISET